MSEDKKPDLPWSTLGLHGGYPTDTFWGRVDTNQRARTHHSTCTGYELGALSCPCGLVGDWAKERGAAECLALMGNGERCYESASALFPFCDRWHAGNALTAFITYIGYRLLSHHTAPPREIAALALDLLRLTAEDETATVGRRAYLADLIHPERADALEDAEPTLAPPTPHPPTPAVRTALYRHYDADDVLLYVGITNDPSMRFREHAKSSMWTAFASRHEGQWLPSREEALAAEAEAIRTEHPLFNKMGADPDRDERVKQYLISHEAWDLLAPVA